MKDDSILSVLPPLGADPLVALQAPPAQRAPGFCAVGEALRAVLGVQVLVGLAAAWASADFTAWLLTFGLWSSAALPAALLWLLLACAVQRRWPWQGQALVLRAAGLGALCSLYGMGLNLGTQGAWLWSGGPGLLSGALLGAVLAHWRVLRAQAQAPALAQARLAELQARIRPHFLFNTLNSAVALVRADPQRAEQLLEDLSDLFRAALAEAGSSVALQDEVALAQRYLAIEQTRFAERLRVHWQLDPHAAAARLPPLLLQPLVENAVHHGVEPSPTGGEVWVQTQARGARVVIKIWNTLPAPAAPAAAPGHGLALDNVRQRLALLHDVQASLRAGRVGERFEVRLELPL